MAKFKTRARALDMLGRQQIAGIPTAINELFKNAYDAYSTKVQADYFRTHNLFILSDNGTGMTLDDFENKWLALGTDSKFNKKASNDYIPANMTKRAVLGEKGIGRLAISTIGSQVLILTRSKKEDMQSRLIAAYIHWGLFELPGINIDDIEIPIKTFTYGEYPTNNDINELICKYEENLNNISKKLEDVNFDSLYKDFEEAKQVLQIELWNEMLKDFSLKDSFGTQFFIPTTDKDLENLLKNYNEIDKCSNLVKYLGGFFNTMTKAQDEIEMDIAFNDHKQIDSTENIIDNSWYWKTDDFNKADLYIKGNFNDNGFFSGELRFGKIQKEYKINCNPSRHKISCSGFNFTMGYIPGLKEESSLSEFEHKEYFKRANSLGGIYIYRNNIRILPYGIPEFDFLELERIRSLRAGGFWFSHRRIFGVIELSDINSNLQEKAGREGFKEGRAYRDFKSVLLTLLQNIMQDIKKDFDLSKENEKIKEKAKNLKKQQKAIDEQAKKNKQILKDFKKNLNTLLSKIDEQFIDDIENLVSSVKNKIKFIDSNEDISQKYKECNDLIDYLNEQLNEIYLSYDLPKTPGIVLDKNTDYTYESYILKYDYQKKLAKEKVSKLTSELKNNIKSIEQYINQKKYIEEKINILNQKIKNIDELEQKQLDALLEKFNSILKDIIKKSLCKHKEDKTDLTNKLAYISSNMYNENFNFNIDELNLYRQTIDNIENEYAKLFNLLNINIDNIFSFSETENELFTLSDREEYYQNQLQVYKDSFEMDFDLVQRGLAIDIINHEFAKEVRTIRCNITRLKKWSEYNENILDIYQNIYSGFTHLDNYLGLFTQMQRRLYKEPMEISGRKINNHIEAVFKEKLEEYNITLNVSQEFLQHVITAYPSTIFPVFVNLIDNAIFWIKDRDKRIITLGIDNNKNYVIQDSGPGIGNNDEFVIFDRGFSRKELGRGLGLYICKEALKKEGFDIRVDNPGETGARFVIYKANQIKAKDEE